VYISAMFFPSSGNLSCPWEIYPRESAEVRWRQGGGRQRGQRRGRQWEEEWGEQTAIFQSSSQQKQIVLLACHRTTYDDDDDDMSTLTKFNRLFFYTEDCTCAANP